VVFDIGGSKYRVVASVDFDAQILVVDKVLTHEEYARELMPVAEAHYRKLLAEVVPAVIETDAQYDSITERLSSLVRKGRSRTVGQTRLMKLLALLVRDYDQRTALPPLRLDPADALRYLLEQSGKRPARLVSVFGQRSHVSEALSGKRKISAEQARKLAGIFRVHPGVFI
jgi:HTH-type transcriptional regulator/antitoxin HigA